MLTENEKLTIVIATGSALISLISVAIALAQWRSSVRLAQHQATFDHLGRVRKLLREVSKHDPVSAREAALAYWNHEVDELPSSANAYLDLLDEWDLLGVAFRENRIDRKLVLKSLRYTFRNPHNVNREFIDQVKKTFENPGVYADLDYLIQCCLRPTWFEKLTAMGKALYGNPNRLDTTEVGTPRSGEMPLEQSEAYTTASTAPTLYGPEGRNSRLSPATPETQPRAEVAVDQPPQVPEGRDTMSEKKTIPTPIPPPVPGPDAGEIPPFRPPRPRP